jgi:hypothetical protein
VRTVISGARFLTARPLAGLPLALEGFIAALLIATGGLPSDGGTAPAFAAFPFDVYFDLKYSLAYAPSWAWFAAFLLLSVAVRSAVLASTLWLADEARGPVLNLWRRCAGLVALALAGFLPVGVLYFAGVALRYAPFVWIAGALGLLPALYLARRAVGLDAGSGRPGGGEVKVPTFGGILIYALALAALGVFMSWTTAAGAALIVVVASLLNAMFFLGWRERSRLAAHPSEGRIVGVLALVGLAVFWGLVFYDRNLRDPAPARDLQDDGTLLVLAGVDSSSNRGALVDSDARVFGYDPRNTELLSYRRGGGAYGPAETRGDLDRAARIMSAQIELAEPPRALLGHSQAALIVDRLLAGGLPAPDRSVQISPPPPKPPGVVVPEPGRDVEGRVGGDLSRVLAAGLDAAGLASFDIDAPAAPTNLDSVVTRRSPRLALWALADSVWLESDWRRPGEVNLVVFSDHVGAINNPRTIEAARRFLGGGAVAGETWWRAALANALRYLFEPWRP